MKQFIRALAKVDKERLKFYHYEKFKAIVNLEL